MLYVVISLCGKRFDQNIKIGLGFRSIEARRPALQKVKDRIEEINLICGAGLQVRRAELEAQERTCNCGWSELEG